MLYKAKVVILTDIDGSMIGYNGSRDGVREAVELLNALHIPVVPVTAKTAHEILYLGEELGFASEGLIAVVEMGGAICSTTHLPLFEDPIEIKGLQCNPLGDLITEFEHMVEEALEGCKSVRLSRASLEDAERILGLKGLEALLATKRLFLEVVWSDDRKCLEEASEKLSRSGLNTFLGRRFLHVGSHRGKGEAVLKLLEILKSVTIGRPKIVGIGDSEADIEFLELVDEPIIIPQNSISTNLRLRRSDYTIAPHPAPQGWIWVARHIPLKM
jgi:mannosyl-3-phosphoglycerate phosphatase family protein